MVEELTPYDTAQLQLIGGLLNGNITLDDINVRAEHIEVSVEGVFYKRIFRAIEALWARRESLMIESVLVKAGINVGNTEAYERLKKLRTSSWYSHDFKEQEKYILTHYAIMQTNNAIQQIARDGVTTLEDVANLQAKIEAVTDQSTSSEQTLSEAFTKLREVIKNGQAAGIPTHLSELNRMIGGWVNPRLYYVGGRSGMGKTQFVINSMLRNIEGNHHAIFFSMEMTKEALLGRMAAIVSNVSQQNLNRPANVGIAESDEEKLNKAADLIESLQEFYTIYEEKMTVTKMRNMIQKVKNQHKDKKIIVYIDYIGIVPDSRRSRDIREKITNIAQDLQTAVKELGVPIVCLSQLNRESAKTNDKIPRLTDLKEAGAIEETADAVVLLHRPSEYIMEPEEKKKYERIMEVYVAKNRYGRTGCILAKWNGATGAITD